ncbi:isochorismatase family protein [Sphingobium sp. H39-3-25]|uniref:isochorismatase family protein n=1 Tax=Sphingobium arseniciresistens TaxID=3030834 RepID=UPI0023B8C53A|nr:isochorismatase family protein [Sphingobium arseniciresistens]
MEPDISELLANNYETTGFGHRLGFGAKPALLLIDLVEAYFREGSPLYHRNFAPALASSVRLMDACRKADIPVILTNVEYTKGGADGGIFFEKIRLPLLCFEKGNPLGDFPPNIVPRADEVIISKRYASAFCGTPLAALLTSQRIDTLIIGGVSTSGCVRATAVDTCSMGFRPMVVREAVGDRHPEPHKANLFDIDAKYGDVVSEEETLAYLAGVQAR